MPKRLRCAKGLRTNRRSAIPIGDHGQSHLRVRQRALRQNEYRDYLEIHGLSVQLTEALAEFWHQRVRADLGFDAEEPSRVEGLFDLEYRGARYSFGYPACPNLEDRIKLVELLKPEQIGVVLSEELQLHPEQSTDAMVLHHPEAKYFSV